MADEKGTTGVQGTLTEVAAVADTKSKAFVGYRS